MKTSWIKSTAVISLLILGIYGSALAATLMRDPVSKKESTGSSTGRQEMHLHRFVRQAVGYPDFLRESGTEARAEVSFRISTEGNLEQVRVHTQDPRLAEYVVHKLSGRKAGQCMWAWGRTFAFALNFRFVQP